MAPITINTARPDASVARTRSPSRRRWHRSTTRPRRRRPRCQGRRTFAPRSRSASVVRFVTKADHRPVRETNRAPAASARRRAPRWSDRPLRRSGPRRRAGRHRRRSPRPARTGRRDDFSQLRKMVAAGFIEEMGYSPRSVRSFCKAPTYALVQPGLAAAGGPVLHAEPIPFPLGNHRARFVEQLRAALPPLS